MKTPRRIRRSAALVTAGVLVVSAAGALAPSVANATPVARQFRIANTDWTAAGVGGIGDAGNGGGNADISISGVSGSVTHAYLMWNGIGWDGTESVGQYNNPTITMNSTSVTGTSQGESGSNCWGDGTSRTYLADVTSIVQAAGGNGDYALSGLGDGGDANGADLVVTFNDGNATNNRDLYLYYGNDTDADGFPGEDNVWNDPITDINYQGGVANVLLGVADGQDFGNPDDGDLMIGGAGSTLDFPDDASTGFLWDGSGSVPDAGFSRAPNGSLFDLKSFDVTGALGSPGVQDLSINSDLNNDCHSLDMAAVDVQATGDVPPPPQTVSVSPASDVEGTAPLSHGKFTKMIFKVTLSAKSATPTTVTLHTEDGTAEAPSDYRSKTQTITIPANKRTKAFKVNVVPDSVAEGDEFFYAVIDSASVPVATNAAVGQIIDDDSSSPTFHAQHAAVHVAGKGGVR